MPAPASSPSLLNEPDRHGVAVKLAVAGLDGGDDDEDGVQDPEDGEEHEADQDQAKDDNPPPPINRAICDSRIATW